MATAITNADIRHVRGYKMMIGQKPPESFVSDGATCAPDHVFSWDVRPAAHWHDYRYSEASGCADEMDRYWADREFLFNLQTCGLPRVIALLYYFRVRFWGTFHYAYAPNRKPRRTFGFWLRIVIGRYIR